MSQLDRALSEQRRIGQLAQAIVIEAERALLVSKGRADLATQVRDVSDDLSLGYDVLSFTANGVEKLIEVKAAARRGDDLRFFLSENERRQSRTIPGYVFALVVDAQSPSASIREFPGKKLPDGSLHSVAYEVRLRAR